MTDCLLCHRPAEWIYHACEQCRRGLQRTLRDLEDVIAGLNPEPGASTGERRSPGFRSTSPARDGVLAALDIRTVTTEDDTTRSVAALAGITGWVAEALDAQRPDETVADHLRWLLTRVDQCAQHDWFDDLAHDVRDLHAGLAGLTAHGPVRPKLIGHCPTPVEGQPCGAPLRLRPGADRLTCRACGTRWDWRDFAQLGKDIA